MHLFAAARSYSTQVPIQIVSMWPKPNYSLCTDEDDLHQLTDGITESRGMWRRQGTVGWAGDLGVIRIIVEVPSKSSHMLNEISIHTASKPSKGVEYPAQIDIFSIEDDGRKLRIGGNTYRDSVNSNDEAMWLTLSLEKPSDKLLLVIKPKGNFFFCDEISASYMPSFETKTQNYLVKNEFSAMNVHTTKNDISHDSHIKALRKNFLNDMELIYWVVDNPFSSLPVSVSSDESVNLNTLIDVYGSNNEQESVCIGVLNLSSSEQRIVIDYSGPLEISKSISYFIVEPILAADEQIVYDPLQPIVMGGEMILPSQRAAYLWLRFDLHKIPVGEQSGEMILRSPDKPNQINIPLRIKVSGLTLSKNLPYAVNWGYSKDMPIWRDKAAALADNLNHNINVAVVHSSKIPLPDTELNWSPQKADILLREISFYKNMTKLLLFLNLGDGKGPESLSHLSSNSHYQKDIFQKWVLRLATLLKSAGVPKSLWALYPVDEPRDKDLEYLRILAEWVKEVDPNILIYANPTSNKPIVHDLVDLDNFVDIWQPHYQCAVANSAFFSNLKKEWWIYQNPPSPAKSASPWLYYRLLSWKAWQMGASGVGFWSYSDTGKSSSWDDLDGERPDWSVVYEGKGLDPKPLSSRRWEAFREGTEDYQLLAWAQYGELTTSNSLPPNLKKCIGDILIISEPSFFEVRELRRELLDRYTHQNF